jgi:DNA uptake protein ComE-like DNA-binding protein
MTASSMGAMGPDLAAAITSGAKIFKIVDTPTKVNAINDTTGEKIDENKF